MLRRILLLQVLVYFLLGLSNIATAAYSDYSGPWQTTDTQSSTYTISFLGDLSSGWSFGVYDIGAGISPSTLVLIDQSSTYATFFVNNHVLNVTQGLSSGQNFALSSSNDWFGFYFSDGSSNYYTYQFDSAGPVNQWLLKMSDSYNAGGPVIASDVAPVPIPGAVWLLGSGLLGLIAIRRI